MTEEAYQLAKSAMMLPDDAWAAFIRALMHMTRRCKRIQARHVLRALEAAR